MDEFLSVELFVLCGNRGCVGCSELSLPLLHKVLHWMCAEVSTYLGRTEFKAGCLKAHNKACEGSFNKPQEKNQETNKETNKQKISFLEQSGVWMFPWKNGKVPIFFLLVWYYP